MEVEILSIEKIHSALFTRVTLRFHAEFFFCFSNRKLLNARGQLEKKIRNSYN